MNGIVLLLGSFLLMVMIKIPVAYALGLSSMLVCVQLGVPLTSAVSSMYDAVSNFSLLAVPLFMLLATLMDVGGITERLLKVCEAFIGHIRGGMGHVNVIVSLLFGHLSGSSQADAAGIGGILIPAMKKGGYDAGFSVAITACSSCLGVIIPPSVLMVVYGAQSGASVGALFVAGLVPGFAIALAQCAYTAWMAKRHNYPCMPKTTWGERGESLKKALPVIILPLIILGGTTSGFFTATESAAVACMYAAFLMFVVYRNYKIKDIPKLMVKVATEFSLSMFAVASAGITGWLIAYLDAPATIAGWILNITDSYIGIYLLLIAFLLVIGTFLSPLSAIIIFMPIFQQLAAVGGFNDIHMGLIIIMTLSLGMVTPPYGTCLMITSQIGEITMPQAFKHVAPILLVTVAVIILFVIFPELLLFIPRMLVPTAFHA